ncbi:hypothetical protein [Azoarcus sp. KH32C]|uniref:hypothetical protein n=1 Tax=Azoarcus sp. KH32C TaxID=748247 RepID=UPI00023860E8|nr:hypothetical protein [Azoarcus sp. KH32C]BAL22972.1 hypothetical protein AZKH_0626 [Azoarcus sp. KH32C]
MDTNYVFCQDRIREAQRLRNEALGQMIADGFQAAKRLATRVKRAVVAHLLGPRHPLPH